MLDKFFFLLPKSASVSIATVLALSAEGNCEPKFLIHKLVKPLLLLQAQYLTQRWTSKQEQFGLRTLRKPYPETNIAPKKRLDGDYVVVLHRAACGH
jgi:hypothetical protein